MQKLKLENVGEQPISMAVYQQPEGGAEDDDFTDRVKEIRLEAGQTETVELSDSQILTTNN